MTSTPHDALFKAVFEQPEHAAAELQHVLPSELRAAVRWPSLRLEPGSFVDAELADQHSDLLFSAETEGTSRRVLVYLLFEHQSSSDVMMALRLLGYMVRIWNRHAQAQPGDPLPPIIPAVLAHAPGGWSAETRFSALFGGDLGGLADTIPEFAFAVDDLHAASDEQLRSRALADLPKVALWLIRDARDATALLRHLADWAPTLEAIVTAPSGREAMLQLLRYISLVSDDMHLDQFRATLDGLAPVTEEFTVTIAERLHAEGRAEGRVEGRAESLLLILQARGFQVPDDLRRRIEAITEADLLDQLLRRGATVERIDDLFAG